MIRPLGKNDYDQVCNLLRQLRSIKKHEIGTIVPVLKKYTSDPDYMIWGYEEDDRIVGFITVSLRQALLYEGKVAIIEDLIVEESHRCDGVCRKLVRFVEDIVESMGVKGIEANSDFQRSDTHDFWEECGYSKLAYQFRKGIHQAN